MEKPKYKVGDSVVIKHNNYHILTRITDGYLPESSKIAQWEYQTEDKNLFWVKEDDIINITNEE